MNQSKQKRSRSLLLLLLISLLLVLALILVITLGFGYGLQRTKSFNARPLVLMHTPINHDQADLGDQVSVHATARLRSGIRRMEFWADDVLVSVKEAPEGTAPASLVLSGSWMPTVTGRHVLTVRAFSTNNVPGQAVVVVEAVDPGVEGAGTHTVQEGETLESIAGDHNTTTGEITELNPDLGEGGPAPGDELAVPDVEDSGGPPAGGAPGGGGDPPEPEDDAPGSVDLPDGFFLEILQFFPLDLIIEEGDPTGLQVEVHALETNTGLESLHCYMGAGDEHMRWVPDTDHDQTTDESFAPLSDNSWQVDEYLSGDGAPVVYWPPNEPLALTLSCVGISGGGTDALELGRLALSIPPEDWDGTRRSAEASGADGSFAIQYSVSQVEDTPRGVPLYLDPDMSSPYDVRLDERRISLRWEYSPRPDEEPIDGFRVYLNGNLQWVEPADARESGLPYEWFNPPCDTTYTFAVTAYRAGIPDGPESLPGIAIRSTPAEDCQREVQITFLTLETFNLGGDGRYEDRSGDVGPVYGYFFANEHQISFDTRSPGGGGSLDMPNGLSHNTVYDLGAMSADRTWHFNGMPAMVAEVPAGGTFEFGFHIMDEDTGRCRDSGDAGCDDLVCEALSPIYQDSLSGALDDHQEGTLTSEDERCRVTYTFGPAFGSPVGSGIDGWEPLPWIEVESVEVDETTGLVEVHVRNTGTATWPWRDLDVELQTREGESLGVFTWEDFVLEAGQRTVLRRDDLRLDPPYDGCVLIDPNDTMLEERERSGAMIHTPVCPRLPDLAISGVEFSGSRIRVSVENVGTGALENRTVALRTMLADGSPAYINASWPDITLAPRQARTFDLIGVTELIRTNLQDGYSVILDPDETIADSDRTNNTFEVVPADLKVWWCDSRIPHYYGHGSTARMFMNVDVLMGTQSRTVFESTWSDTLSGYETFAYGYDYHCFEQGCNYAFSCRESSEVFHIMSDEVLRVSIRGDYLAGERGDRENLGTGTHTFDASRNWGAVLMETAEDRPWHTYCRTVEVVPPLGMLAPEAWFSQYCIGQLPP